MEASIGAKIGEFQRKMREVTNTLRKIPNTVRVNIKTNADNVNKRIDELANNFRNVGLLAQSVIGGAFGMIAPTIVPAVASAVGALGGLASAFVSAGAGAVGFGAVAVTALNDVFEASEEVNKLQEELANTSDAEERAEILQEISQQYNNLTGAQQGSLMALQQFQAGWSNFASQFQPDILNIFNRSLEQLGGLIQRLEPMFAGAVQAFDNLSISMGEAFKQPDMQRFFDFLNSTAQPMIETFGAVFGNVMRGIMNLMVAFAPTAQNMGDGLLSMSESFLAWSQKVGQSQGFQQFIDYVNQNGPKLLQLVGSIVSGMIAFGVAIAPLASKVLSLVASFAEWAAGMLETFPIISIVTTVIGMLISAFSFLWPLISVGIAAFTAISNILKNTVIPAFKRVWNWVGAKLLQAFAKFGNFLNRIIPPIMNFAGTVLRGIGGAIRTVLPWILRIGSWILRLVNPITIVISAVIAIAAIIVSQWDKIWAATKSVFSSIGQFLSSFWDYGVLLFQMSVQGIWNIIQSAWNWILDTTINIFTSVWNFLSNIWNNITSFISNTVSNIWDTISNGFQNIVNSIKEKMNDAKTAIQNVWNNIWEFLQDLPSKMLQFGKDLIQGLIDGITSMIGNAVSAVGDVANSVISTVTSIFSFGSPSKLFRQYGVWLFEGMNNGVESMKNSVIRKFRNMGETATNAFKPELRNADFADKLQSQIRNASQTIKGNVNHAVNIPKIAGNVNVTPAKDEYATINIGGYEAEGLIRHFSREQERQHFTDKQVEW